MAPTSTRGEVTKTRMLEAGARIFARYGPDGVSTRRLAQEAGVNPAAIQYHFGSKEGYYVAVVRHLVETMSRPLVEKARRLDNMDMEMITPSQATEELSSLLKLLLRLILTEPHARDFGSISAREHLNPTAAYEEIYKGLEPIHRAVTRLVARASGLPAGSFQAIIRAHALVGMVLFFRAGTTMLTRRAGKDDINERDLQIIAAEVESLVRNALRTTPQEARR